MNQNIMNQNLFVPIYCYEYKILSDVLMLKIYSPFADTQILLSFLLTFFKIILCKQYKNHIYHIFVLNYTQCVPTNSYIATYV